MCRREAFDPHSDRTRAIVRTAHPTVRPQRRALLALLVTVTTAGIGLPALTDAMELVSINRTNRTGDAASKGVAVNGDGTFVAFYSDADDLLFGDTNQARDVFLRDRSDPQSEHTELISINTAGEQGNLSSHAAGDAPAIDGDGQIVAFDSDATNLVPNDANGHTDVFVRLRATSVTERVSLNSSGVEGNDDSRSPSIDRVGRFVAFQSLATNLVPNDTNNQSDIFVRDRTNGTTERACDATVQANGFSAAPAISADGTVVAFTSAATNFGPVDNNDHLDIYACDRTTGIIDLVSVSTDGVQGDGDSILPAISQDGRFVAFKSLADNLVPNDHNNLVDVFVRDRLNHTTERISVNFLGGDSNDVSYPPSISWDGRFVAFGSAANNIVRTDENLLPSVFVRDRDTEITLLVDVNDAGEQANGATIDAPPSVSGDGRQIGFMSNATNLTNNQDLNSTTDVFIQSNPFCQQLPEECGEVTPPTPTGRKTATATPTPTPTSPSCCQCEGPACTSAAETGTCPDACTPVALAACLPSGNCATFTPTPTPTPVNCCQCDGTSPSCSLAPANATCPDTCTFIPLAVCLTSGNCATFTPTPTPPKCCQCTGASPSCSLATDDVCPTDCTLVPSAVCLATGNCATLTPTPTHTPTPLNCCQCDGGSPSCSSASTSSDCSNGCVVVPSAVCLASGNCATVTPTRTITPCPTTTPCPVGFFQRCTDTNSPPCDCFCVACPVPTCAGGGECIFDTFNTCSCTCEATRTQTPTPTATRTQTFTSTPTPEGTVTATNTGTPTRTFTAIITPQGSVTATVTATPGPNLDLDSCHCTVTPGAPHSTRGACVWLSGVLVLWLRRRRYTALRGSHHMRHSALVLAVCLTTMLAASGARADGPFIGVDTGVSEPTNGNYRGHVRTGMALNPYLGYMFTDYLGVQGQMHFSYQSPDFHPDRGFKDGNQTTTLLGGTIGPRVSVPLTDLFELYGTVQGGMFTGLSGSLSQSAAGFSAGPGLNYNVAPNLGIGLFARFNRSYMAARPLDLTAQQVPSERYRDDIQWMTAGIGVRYSFPHTEAPPPPPPPPPPLPPVPPAPVKKRIVLRAVYFDFDKSNIRPDAAPVLDEAVTLLQEEGEATVVAEGHTDAVGSVRYNIGLSLRRADAVRKYLVDHGLNASRIRTEGFGKSRPVATNDTEDGRAQNRRVELRVE